MTTDVWWGAFWWTTFVRVVSRLMNGYLVRKGVLRCSVAYMEGEWMML